MAIELPRFNVREMEKSVLSARGHVRKLRDRFMEPFQPGGLTSDVLQLRAAGDDAYRRL